MRINSILLPMKAHWFFFMAAMGPILPQLSVYGKELGISSVVMGTITGILPFAFLLAKPLFGMLVDVYRDFRKAIFMSLIFVMTLSYALMYLIPTRPLLTLHYENFTISSVATCNVADFEREARCTNETARVHCFSKGCDSNFGQVLASKTTEHNYSLCTIGAPIPYANATEQNNCDFSCNEEVELKDQCLYQSFSFWSFILLMSLGTIGFNVVNSISDAICFDVIGEEYDYGKQRVWGTIGFGVTALLSGYIIDLLSEASISYTPGFILMIVCSVIDLFACLKLKLPVIEAPENILKDLRKLANNRNVVTFLTFAVFAGILDGLIIYFLFWYLEDLAIATDTTQIKLIEGLVVAAETLGGEVIFFSISGKILERFGHLHCFSMCFLNYALRLGLISLAPNPWWIIPVEFLFQGPTYALTYTTIVAYANELAPAGTSATMQGIAAGMDDGIGYAIGSIVGGLLFEYLGGRHTLQIFSAFGVFCSVLHFVLHKTLLRKYEKEDEVKNNVIEYKTTEEAYKATISPDC